MNNIYITGFMGSGKSTIARILAKATGRTCVDMDDEIQRKLDMPIAKAFETYGEQDFRVRETELLKSLATQGNLVVATGGGTPVSETNRTLMKQSGTIILLDASPEAIAGRIGNKDDSRPNWISIDHATQLLLKRAQAYKDCNIVVKADEPPQDIINNILQKLCDPQPFWAEIDDHTIPVIPSFTPQITLAKSLDARTKTQGKAYSAIVFITDDNVAELHLKRFRDALPHAASIVIKPGEDSKTLRQAETVFEQLLALGIGRDALIIAIGGGMVTDFAAFVAATYKRGIDFILVSTTLLGCVDAVIGGKTAVNLNHYKNQVGLFALPTEIYLDLTALRTLSAEKISEGLVEAYKTGLACDEILENTILENLDRLMKNDIEKIADVAINSAQAKAKVVNQDFHETGLRKILNLGHTYGHAMETWCQEKTSHGRCVGVGMIVAVNIARQRKLIDPQKASEIIETTRKILGNVPMDFPSAEQALQLMKADKKNTEGKISFILPKGNREFTIAQDIQLEELKNAINIL
jgi:3-dehydroquinate synthase